MDRRERVETRSNLHPSRAATSSRNRLSDAGMKKAGTICSTFINNWWMPGFFMIIQAQGQGFWIKEKINEQSQNAN